MEVLHDLFSFTLGLCRVLVLSWVVLEKRQANSVGNTCSFQSCDEKLTFRFRDVSVIIVLKSGLLHYMSKSELNFFTIEQTNLK